LILYLDTSAIVKLYVREAGSTEVKRWLEAAEAAGTSWVAYAETRAAFSRALRERVTSPEEHLERVGQFNRDWESTLRISLSPLIVRAAGDLTEVYGLRGFDAIHLASALWLRDKCSDDFGVAVYDHRLREAAATAGLRVVE
jgi:predicted nucleic acid-binding protein